MDTLNPDKIAHCRSLREQLEDARIRLAQYEERKLLSARDVIKNTTLGRASLYSLVSRGEFPKPIRITAGRVAWDSAAVDSWIAARIAAAA
jgi:prophage regulatory protein